MTLRRTGWYSAKIHTPEYVGLYEIKIKQPLNALTRHNERFRYWDGQQWRLVLRENLRPDIPSQLFNHPHNCFFRGLTKKSYEFSLSNLQA